MDPRRLGTVFRSVRFKRLLRQEDVAARSGVSRTTISRIERGKIGGPTLDTILAVADALDIRVDVLARWQGADLDRLLDSRHSALHESVASAFGALPGWIVAPEVSFALYTERGAIDLLCWHAVTRTVLVIELKTEIVDVQELIGVVDRKRRLASRIARDRGWESAITACWVIVADSRTNRRRLHAHATVLRAAFPVDGRSVGGWLRRPKGAIAALSFWSNARQVSVRGGLATRRRVRRQTRKAA